MKYLSTSSIVAAYKNNAQSTKNKFWGLLAVLYSIDQKVFPCVSYQFNQHVVGYALDEFFLLDGKEKTYPTTQSLSSVIFSTHWIEVVKKEMLSGKPNIYDIIVWCYKDEAFDDNTTTENLLSRFINDFSLSDEFVTSVFSLTERDYIVFGDKLSLDKEILIALELDSYNGSITAENSTIVSLPHELSRAPFFQTLYSSQSILAGLIITNFDFDEYYLNSSNSFPNTSASLSSLEPSQCTKYTEFLTALRTKPFLLLAGISGTGKSRIVKEMAFASCPDVAGLRNDPVSPGNYLLVEVKPNWHDSTELLGYESTIKKGYVLTPFVKFLYKAMKHPDVPFFVCLDEMNLAPVEQYFAEYLSILESRKQQADGTILTEPLIGAEVFRKYPELCAEMNGTAVRRENVKNTYMTTDPAVEYVATEREYENLCEEGLRIPQNVVVIGTVNMDETTHQFSRKVIDRAMTIEMNEVKFDGFFESSSELTYPDRVLPKKHFLPCHTTAGKALESVPDDAEYIKANVPAMLEQLNEALADTPFKIAYRVQNELVLYFAALRQEEAHKATGTAELLATAMDQILMMKVLPRIEGDDELLEKPLERLAVYAEGYPKASAKIKEMQERLGRSHFTSFWP